jgi:hypothetical protein
VIEIPVRYNTRAPADPNRPRAAVPDNLPPSLSNVQVKDLEIQKKKDSQK